MGTDVYISKRWLPGSWERHSWVIHITWKKKQKKGWLTKAPCLVSSGVHFKEVRKHLDVFQGKCSEKTEEERSLSPFSTERMSLFLKNLYLSHLEAHTAWLCVHSTQPRNTLQGVWRRHACTTWDGHVQTWGSLCEYVTLTHFSTARGHLTYALGTLCDRSGLLVPHQMWRVRRLQIF